MVFPVVGGTQDTGYEISNSLRFNDDDGAYLRKTLGTATNRKILTFSTWVKRSNLTLYSYLLVANTSAPYSIIGFDNADQFSFQLNAGSGSVGVFSNAKFRDPSAWYHFVGVLDTTQGTSSNRIKIYVNGSQITSLSASSYPDQNSEWNINNSVVHDVGGSGAVQDFDGYMADTHFIDGQALDPTYFGETDNNGVWIPKRYTGTYGNNGFYLEFKQTGTGTDASGMGADTSGNDNHFAPTNLAATDVTEDTPTNNFATLNPINTGTNLTRVTFSEGNNKVVKSGTTSSNGDQPTSSQGFANGKWYWEVKVLSNADNTFIGIFNDVLGGLKPYHNNYAYGIYGGSVADGSVNGTQVYLSQESSQKGYGLSQSGGTAFSDNDILQFAFDTSTYRLYLGLNGQWTNNNSSSSAAPTGGSAFNQSTPTGYFEVPTTAAKAGTWRTIIVPAGSSENYSAEFNFGNPSFAISSGNSDANGYGNFEYAVPSGFYSLCTKNLAEYG